MSSFKSNENIHKKEDWSYYVVSANKRQTHLEWLQKRNHTKIGPKDVKITIHLFGAKKSRATLEEFLFCN